LIYKTLRFPAPDVDIFTEELNIYRVVPLMLKVKLYKPVYLLAGAYGAYAVQSWTSYSWREGTNSMAGYLADNFERGTRNKYDWGVNAGIGAQYTYAGFTFFIEGRVDKGFYNILSPQYYSKTATNLSYSVGGGILIGKETFICK